MAGSLNHIVAPDGGMTMELVENGGDRLEALEECFDLIATLAKDKRALDRACKKLGFPIPKAMPVAGKRNYRLASPSTLPTPIRWPPEKR